MCFSKDKNVTRIRKIVGDILELYDTVDGHISFRGVPVNLATKNIKMITIDNPDFYYETYMGISQYKDILKDILTKFGEIQDKYGRYFLIEKRIKNINSIYSKVFKYIYEKPEKGEIQINKCLNDLFGLRITLNIFSFDRLGEIIKEAIEPYESRLKFIDSSKDEYRAYHLYLKKNNYQLQWEIQFWLKRDSRKNRKSHHEHKQAYTSWELNFKEGNLIEVIGNEE